MLQLFDGKYISETCKDVRYLANHFKIPNRNYITMTKLTQKVQECILENEESSNFVVEYLKEKIERPKASEFLPKLDLSPYVGKYFKAQASYMVNIYKVVGNTKKMLRIGPAKTIFTGTIHYPAYIIDEKYEVVPECVVKLIEHEGSHFFKHKHFTYFEVDPKQYEFTCCEY